MPTYYDGPTTSTSGVRKLDPLKNKYLRATLLSYEALLIADYLDSHETLTSAKAGQVDPTVATLLPGFVSAGTRLPRLLPALAKQLGERSSELDRIVVRNSEENLRAAEGKGKRKHSAAHAGQPLRKKMTELAASPLFERSARIWQTIAPDDPGASGNSGDSSTAVDPGTDTGTSSNDPGTGTSSSDADATASVGTSYLDFAPDVQQATGVLWQSTAGPQLAPYFEAGVSAVSGGGDVDINGLNATLTGVVTGIAASVGGVFGAALASAALILIPRMLEAVEDALADYLVGDLPGF